MQPKASDFVRDSFDLIDELDAIECLDQLKTKLASHFSKCGVAHFLMTRVPSPGQEIIAPLLLIDSFPGEWLRYYDERRFVRHDPVTARLVSSFDPFLWSDVQVDRRSGPTAFQIMSEAADLGMADGFSIPISTPEGFQGCISLSGQKLDLSPEERRALHMASLFAYGAAERLHSIPTKGGLVPLSDREREVLRWIAVGSRHREIADVLGISERTVEAHLENARRKLRARNTTHTAVLAIQQRQIRL